MNPQHDGSWQTTLFLTSPSTRTQAPAGTISARLAYQHGLYGRAVIVDLRAHRRLRLDPTLPAATSVAAALAAGAARVVVLTDGTHAQPTDPRALVLDGGIDAWVEAGLPVVASDVRLAA